jgi:nucleoside transporter
MMFLQYFAWGAWFAVLGAYLGAEQNSEFFEPGFIGTAVTTMGWGAIVAPFLVGMIADRFFSTQVVLGVLHIAGAGLLYLTSTITDQTAFYWTLLAFFMTFMPTLALTNSISFHNLAQPDKTFPYIRVAGTIGWIVAGLSYGLYARMAGLDVKEYFMETPRPMLVGAATQLILGVYCFFLPPTPPPKKGMDVSVSEVLGLDALRMFRLPGFAVFMICSLLICIPLQFYYGYTSTYLGKVGVDDIAGLMTIGQMSEIGFMLLMPLFFLRLGVKYMLLIGMLSWGARYVLFAYGDASGGAFSPEYLMLIGGLALHGICYDFFFVTGQIYTDQKSGPEIRGAAQGFLTLVTLGLGTLLGGYAAGWVEAQTTVAGTVSWTNFWLIPASFAGVVAVLFFFTFYDRKADAALEDETDEFPEAPQLPA